MRPQTTFPPPFRFLYYFACAMRKARCCGVKYEVINSKLDTSKRNDYITLMLRLVKTKMQRDEENSFKDDFDDLRKDIKNIMSNKETEEMKKEISTLKLKLASYDNSPTS